MACTATIDVESNNKAAQGSSHCCHQVRALPQHSGRRPSTSWSLLTVAAGEWAVQHSQTAAHPFFSGYLVRRELQLAPQIQPRAPRTSLPMEVTAPNGFKNRAKETTLGPVPIGLLQKSARKPATAGLSHHGMQDMPPPTQVAPFKLRSTEVQAQGIHGSETATKRRG